MFLDQLRFTGDICHHPNDAFHVEWQTDDRLLKCRECDRGLSLRTYLCDLVLPEHSLKEAERYVAWTGDAFVPCRLSTELLSSRTLPTTLVTDYASVSKAHTLLKMLHSPFLYASEPPAPTPAGLAFFQQTLDSPWDAFLQRAAEEKEASKDVCLIVTHALTFFKHHAAREAARYFDVLAPYVKSVHRRAHGTNRFFFDTASGPLHLALNDHLNISRVLHKTHAPYSAAFDLVHVAALCVLGRTDFRWVCELILDFVGQFGSGYYEAAFPFPGLVPLDPLETALRQKWQDAPPPLLAPFSRENLAEHFSDAFFQKFETWHRDEDRVDWLFPRILFRHAADYYAFRAARAYYAYASTDETVIPDCKTIYRCVKQSVVTLQAFRACLEEMHRQGGQRNAAEMERPFYWSIDLVTHFLRTSPAWTRMVLEGLDWFCHLPATEATAEAKVPEKKVPCGEAFGCFRKTESVFEGLWMPDKIWKYYMKSPKTTLRPPVASEGETEAKEKEEVKEEAKVEVKEETPPEWEKAIPREGVREEKLSDAWKAVGWKK